MKPEDWTFRGIVPTVEDERAKCISYSEFQKFISTPRAGEDIYSMSGADRDILFYNCGFTRGMAWVRDAQRNTHPFDKLKEVLRAKGK